MKIYIYIVMITFGGIAFADLQREEVSIRDCLTKALENNLGIRVQSFQPRIATKDVVIAQGNFDPVITFDAIYDNSNSANVQQFQINNLVIQDEFQKNAQFGAYSAGVSKRHSLGGSVGVFYNFNYFKNAFDGDNNNSVFNYETELRVTQSLLRNFGIDANNSSINIAKNNLQIAKYEHAAKVLAVFADVQLAYLDLVNAIENVRLQKEALQLSRTFYKITQSRIKSGAAPAIDLLDAERDIAKKQDNLVVAEQNVSHAEDKLKSLIRPSSLSYYKNVRLIPTEIPRNYLQEANFEETVQYAIDHRMDIKRSRLNLKNADIDISFQKNQLLPKLDLTVNLGLQGEDTNHTTALQQVYQLDEVSWGVQVSLEVPIGNRIAVNRYQKVILQKQQLITQYRELENNVALEIRNNIRSLETSARRTTTAAKTRSVTERQITVAQKKYRAGFISLFRLQNTEKSLTEAKVNEVDAIIEHQKAIVKLERAKWALAVWLEKYNIQLPFTID